MELFGVGPLDEEARATFVVVTTEFYHTVYDDRTQVVGGVSEFTTSLAYTGQIVEKETNTITYNQQVSFVSTASASAKDVIQGPFLNTHLTMIYVNLLKEQSLAFANLSSVAIPTLESIPPTTLPPAEVELDYDKERTSFSAGAMAGTVIACLVLLAIWGVVILRHIKANKPPVRRIVRVGTMAKDDAVAEPRVLDFSRRGKNVLLDFSRRGNKTYSF